jgi:thiol:disulfide interchange protein DsbD
MGRILLWLAFAVPVWAQEPGIIVRALLSQDRLAAGQAFQVAVVLELTAPWHVNANPPSSPEFIPTQVTFASVPGITLGAPRYPAGKTETVSWNDTPVALYSGKVVILADAKVAGDSRGPVTIKGQVRYQACDDHVCFAPKMETFELPVEIVAAGTATTAQHPEIFAVTLPPPVAPEENSIGKMLRERGLAPTLVFLFISGLLLNLTPCVYPMIAITVSYFGGQGSSFGRALMYCAGIVLTYSLLGMVAALTGGLFGALLQSPWVLAGIGLLLVAMALSLFGLYELQPPAALMQKAAGMGNTASFLGLFLLGATVGIIAAPCLAPVVVVVLAFAGSSGDPWTGWWLFFALGSGLGLPYVFLGTFSGLLTKLPRSGTWMVKVKIVFGVLLLVVAGWITHPLWWPTPAKADVSADQIRQQIAAAAGKPVLLDFYADWCAPCKEMEKLTFPDPRVKAKLQEFVFIKVDVTRQGAPAVQELMREYAVRGVPTYVFLDATGKQRTDCRQVGFLPAGQLVDLLERASR